MAAKAVLAQKAIGAKKGFQPTGGGKEHARKQGGTGVNEGEEVMVRKQYYDSGDWLDEEPQLEDVDGHGNPMVLKKSGRSAQVESCMDETMEYCASMSVGCCNSLLSTFGIAAAITDIDPYVKIELKPSVKGELIGLHSTSPIIAGGANVQFCENDRNMATFQLNANQRETTKDACLQVILLDEDVGADYTCGFAQIGLAGLYSKSAETWSYIRVPVYEGGGDNYGGKVSLKGRWVPDNAEEPDGSGKFQITILNVTDVKEQPGKSNKSDDTRFAMRCLVAYILLMFVIGPGIFMALEPESFPLYINAVWFVVVTVTSVGYGDFSPSSDFGKLFNAFFIVLTFSLMGILMAIIVSWIMELTKQAEVAAKNAANVSFMGGADAAEDVDVNNEMYAHEDSGWGDLGQMSCLIVVLVTIVCLLYGFEAFPGEMCDVKIAGKKKCADDRDSCVTTCGTQSVGYRAHAKKFKNATLNAGAESLITTVLTDCKKGCVDAKEVCDKDDAAAAGADACGGHFINAADLVHYCFVSMSTVGYGDVNPQTPGGQVFGIFFLLIGVSLLAQTVGALMDLIMANQQKARLGKMVDRQLGSVEEISQFDVDGDGEVTKFEFLYTILKITEEVPPATLDMIVARFNTIDTDGSGVIDQADFESFLGVKPEKGGTQVTVEPPP